MSRGTEGLTLKRKRKKKEIRHREMRKERMKRESIAEVKKKMHRKHKNEK